MDNAPDFFLSTKSQLSLVVINYDDDQPPFRILVKDETSSWYIKCQIVAYEPEQLRYMMLYV